VSSNDGIGHFYLRAADQWPSFQLHDLQIGADGSLGLTAAGSGFSSRGVFLAGPFQLETIRTAWFRLRATTDVVPDGAHFQLFAAALDSGAPPFQPNDDNPFADPVWQPKPRDVFDVLVQGSPTRLLWVGALMRSDGRFSPKLRQMRVDYGRDTYLQFLPALYGKDPNASDFLERFLALEQSVLGGLEETIEDLPSLFDPHAAPAGDFPSWLGWLASWLAFDVDESWSTSQLRRYLAHAFTLYGKRGTIEGLRRYLKIYAGVAAHIEEPIAHASIWTLDGKSALGFSTMLAPSHAEGAVLNSTATLDRSYLTRREAFGEALFADVAHRFCVRLYCADLTRPGALEDARAIIEREKPAHTVCHVCLIEPRMRVGAQARVGIDAIVARPEPAHLGMPLDTGVLVAKAEQCGKEA
jgi:phage tail-like protein